jgi:hypothetical protein
MGSSKYAAGSIRKHIKVTHVGLVITSNPDEL